MTEQRRLTWAGVRRGLRLLGLAAGGLLLLYQIVLAYQAVRISEVSIQRPGWIAAAFLGALATNGVLTGGWLIIMRRLGVGLTGRQALAGYSLSFLPRYIPGSIWGYLSRNEWLLQRFGVSYGVANWGSVLEVAFILVAGAGVSLVNLIQTQADNGPVWAGGVLLVIAGFVALTIRRPASYLNRLLARRGLAMPDLDGRTFAALALVYALLWLCHGGVLYAIGMSTGALPGPRLPALVFAYYVAWTVGFLVLFVPSGLGIRETTLTGLLAVAAGMSSDDAVVMAVMARGIGLVAELVWVAGNLAAQSRSGKVAENE